MAKYNFTPSQFTRDQVHKRLKANVEKFWEIEQRDAQSIDPMVEMLLGACAAEFEKSGEFINNAQNRILERLSELLVPEVYTNARPAHGVAHFSAEKSTTELSELNQFLLKSNEDEKQIVLSPIGSQKIFDVDISAQFHGNKLVFYDSPTRKGRELVGQGYHKDLWLGLRVGSKFKSLQGLTIYFFSDSNRDNQDVFSLIQKGGWFLKDQPIKVINGLLIEQTDHSKITNFTSEQEKEIAHFYGNRFVTILDSDISDCSLAPYPKIFPEVFSKDQLTQLKENLTWIQIRFDTINIPEALDEVYCTPNCCPVLNRKFETNNRPFALNAGLNMLPVKADGYVLEMHRVHSGDRIYRNHSVQQLSNNNLDGSYSIRRGGSFRFDERDARRLISQLYNLLRDESAAFNAFGHRALSTEIKTLDQGIERLRLHFKDKMRELDSVCNLIIHTDKKEDVWIEFWSTLGHSGSGKHRGKRLEILIGDGVRRESPVLLTDLFGGCDPLDESEKVYAFKNVLLTRNRIVTEEDIRATCFAHLGNRLKTVTIRKGFIRDENRKSGFTKTIRVILEPTPGQAGLNWQWEAKMLKSIIQRRKIFLSDIQVTVIKAGSNDD